MQEIDEQLEIIDTYLKNSLTWSAVPFRVESEQWDIVGFDGGRSCTVATSLNEADAKQIAAMQDVLRIAWSALNMKREELLLGPAAEQPGRVRGYYGSALLEGPVEGEKQVEQQ